MSKAANLFRRFFGHAPGKDDIVTVGMKKSDEALVIGELYGVIYQTVDSDKPYIHRFNKTDRPLLCVSSDGEQIYVLRGAYKFTDRGFIG